MFINFSNLKRVGYCGFVFLALVNPALAGEKLDQPMLVIPEVSGPPSPTEQEEGCAILENFLSVDSNVSPKESTRLRLCYDKTHLYISGKVSSYALNPVSNMADSFRVKAVKRDESVTADDSVEIRIETSNTAKFSIAINALGTIQDMRYESHPDKTWDGDIVASAQKGDGFWTFRMAIPFAAVDLSEVSEGKSVLFNAIRHDSISGERSLLDHRAIALIFGGKSAFAQIPLMELPLSSTEPLSVKVLSANGEALAWKREMLKNEAVVSESAGSMVASSNDVDLSLKPLSGKKLDANRERFSIYANGHVIYRSPALPWRNEQSEIKITANAEVPFTVVFNGDTLSADAKKIEKSALLRPGANTLTVRIPAGHIANFRISGPDGALLDIGDLWNNPKSVSQEDIYEKTIAYQVTRLSPDSSDGISKLATGSAQFFHWDGGGSKNWSIDSPLDNFRLVVDVPEGIRFLGASGYMSPLTAATEGASGDAAEVVDYTWSKEGQVKYGASTFDRYVIKRSRPVVLSSKKESWLDSQARRQNGVVFAVQDTRGNVSDALPPIYYSMAAQDLIEVPNKLEFQVLPPLEGLPPKRIILSLYTRLGLMKDKDLLAKLFDTMKAAGINEVFSETISEHPRKIGMRQTTFFGLGQSSWPGFRMGTLMTDSVIKAYPDAQAINFYGKKMGTPCLAWLADHEEPWPLIEEQIAAMAKRNPSLSHFFWDYEFPPFPEGIHAYPMFSEFGVRTFRKQYGIEEELTPEVIRERYSDKWVEFTCAKIARVVERLRQASARHGLQFAMYSGYQMPYTQRRYNVDWSKLGSHLDFAYCGYTKDRRLVEDTREALGGTPLIGALLAQGISAPRRSVATIVRTLIDNGGGVLFWYEGGGFDGGTLEPIAAASRFASAYETLLGEAKREDIAGLPGSDQGAVILLRHDQEALLVLLNEGGEPRTFSFDLPREISENYSAEGLKEQGRMAEIVPPGEVRAFLFRKKLTNK